MIGRAWLDRTLSRFGSAIGTGDVKTRLDDTCILLGKLLAEQISHRDGLESIQQAEFKVFSQFGDDGIIQYLVRQTGIPESERRFVEFGVQDYEESNTRFLLMNDNWQGLVIDGDASQIARIHDRPYFWKHDLTAVVAFVNRDNINGLLTKAGISGRIGLLSIDIDGNDYWVWQAITAIDPAIVVIEYNSLFGSDRAVTIPYDSDFRRTRAHYSNLYWGASLRALWVLGRRKGYVFVGCNSAGNNAYFVRNDRAGSLRVMEPHEGFVRARFRESRDQSGRLNFLGPDEQLRAIADLKLVDVESDERIDVAALSRE